MISRAFLEPALMGLRAAMHAICLATRVLILVGCFAKSIQDDSAEDAVLHAGGAAREGCRVVLLLPGHGHPGQHD